MSFEIKSFDGKFVIKVEHTLAINKTIDSVTTETMSKPDLDKEISLYGEALRLRNELLSKPERVVQTITGQITIPAQNGIDVLTCTLQEISNALEDAKINNYKVRTEFLLRVISVRFKNFDTTLVNISKIETDILIKLKVRATDNLEFLGECGFGISPDGNIPKLYTSLP